MCYTEWRKKGTENYGTGNSYRLWIEGRALLEDEYYEKNEQDHSTGRCGIISCTSPMMVMASDSSSVMSQAEEILKDNEIESLASDPDKVGDIIVYVKGLFDSNQISDDEISQGIDEAADHYGVTLSEDDKNSLVNIISKFRGIDISDDQIKGYVSDAYSTLKDMGVTKSDVKNIFEKAIEFIKGMHSRQ